MDFYIRNGKTQSFFKISTSYFADMLIVKCSFTTYSFCSLKILQRNRAGKSRVFPPSLQQRCVSFNLSHYAHMRSLPLDTQFSEQQTLIQPFPQLVYRPGELTSCHWSSVRSQQSAPYSSPEL